MTTIVTIDRAGRIVVPKTVRDELKLEGGTRLEIRVCDGRIELEPAATSMRLERRDEGLVATAEEPLPPLSSSQVRAITTSLRR